jgi:hypothetical protein
VPGRRRRRALPRTPGEVEGELAAGQLAQRHRPPGVQPVGGAERLQCLCTLAEGRVEVAGIGQVQLRLDPQRAVVGDLVAVHGHMPRVRALRARIRGVLGRQHRRPVPAYRLGHHPVHLPRAASARERRHLGIHPSGRLPRQGRMGVDGCLRHPARSPRRDLTALHPPVEPRQPVLQLQRLSDQVLGRDRGHPQHRPNSAMQNSATNGHPTPAIRSSPSAPGTWNAAASWIDSGGCASAHPHASPNSSASAASASRRRSRAAANSSAIGDASVT